MRVSAIKPMFRPDYDAGKARPTWRRRGAIMLSLPATRASRVRCLAPARGSG